MNIGKKEVIFVWGGIIIFLAVVTKLIHNFYMARVFQYITKYTGDSLASTLFWVGWIIILLFALNVFLKWCIYNDNLH